MTTGTEGLKMWVQTLVSYDAFGHATIIKSFAYPAADSDIKYAKKTAKKKAVAKPVKERIKVEVIEEVKKAW
jgi:hypothetical protein